MKLETCTVVHFWCYNFHFHKHTPLVGVSFKGVEGSMETRSLLELVESRLGSLLVAAVNVAATKIFGSCKGNKWRTKYTNMLGLFSQSSSRAVQACATPEDCYM